MSVAVFVDTNVFVYARDASEPGKQAAAEAWLRTLWAEQRGRTSVQVLSEYYAVVTRKRPRMLDPDEAWDDVTALLAWEPQPIDAATLSRARSLERRYHFSWWDALIVAAAQLQDCEVLLTEDLQHGLRCDGVTIRNPFSTAVEEPVATYPSVQRVTRHRGRGRPPRRSPAETA